MKVAVIVHDFGNMSGNHNENRMQVFREKQPTTFESAGLVFTCGKLDKELGVRRGDVRELEEFLYRASFEPEEMRIPSRSKKMAGNFFSFFQKLKQNVTFGLNYERIVMKLVLSD